MAVELASRRVVEPSAQLGGEMAGEGAVVEQLAVGGHGGSERHRRGSAAAAPRVAVVAGSGATSGASRSNTRR